ncbi:hypothetical protein DB88DRAFT_475592 [Papiliotrema laurentii]|uniref:Uncharacterized protein n=1 Tax=Papiliotrema laurentii TaxID=5418 RepID=A0AAD9CSC9_PAPLA|nr:hypothetical protein DB88DRAFT_475592 [Papiliotrema laurentii]
MQPCSPSSTAASLCILVLLQVFFRSSPPRKMTTNTPMTIACNQLLYATMAKGLLASVVPPLPSSLLLEVVVADGADVAAPRIQILCPSRFDMSSVVVEQVKGHSTPRFIVAAQVEQTPCIAMAVGLMFVIVSPLTPVTDTTSPFKHISYPGNPSPPAPPDKSPMYIIPCSPFFRCVHAYPLLLGSQAGITAAVCNCTLNPLLKSASRRSINSMIITPRQATALAQAASTAAGTDSSLPDSDGRIIIILFAIVGGALFTVLSFFCCPMIYLSCTPSGKKMAAEMQDRSDRRNELFAQQVREEFQAKQEKEKKLQALSRFVPKAHS